MRRPRHRAAYWHERLSSQGVADRLDTEDFSAALWRGSEGRATTTAQWTLPAARLTELVGRLPARITARANFGEQP